jgi:uncharacterized protein (TIGR03118 family)
MFNPSSRVAQVFLLFVLATLTSTVTVAQHFTRTNLTANRSGVTATDPPNIDPNLVNAWGLSRSSGSFWWVADNGTGLSTLYDGTGAPQQLVVTIPAPAGSSEPSTPTGTVYNFLPGLFAVAPGKPAVFLFVTEDGTISGWNPTVNLTSAVIKVNRAGKASYKGVAIAKIQGDARLYATNFMTGKIDVFSPYFNPITVSAGAFQDSQIPAGYSPFNIQNVGGNLVVTFAKKPETGEDEEHGPGLGYVSVFDTAGSLLLRLQHGNFLNAPWGVALAPNDFGPFAHQLLIGNFGDGHIHAFNALTGAFMGTLLNNSGTPITIDGLWALGFGNNANAGSATELFFTAGPNDESDGLFGKLTPSAAEGRGNTQ